MKVVLFFSLIFTILVLPLKPGNKIQIFLAGDSTMSIKETRAYPETGWGMPFASFWDSSITVINKAKNGRSTRTFISEGLWNSIASNMHNGDVVFIQFGHNDESKEKTDRYTDPETYMGNLTKMVEETRQKGGTPILLTPVSRRKFDKDGHAVETHAAYSPLVKQVAQKTGTLFINLDSLSLALYNEMGPENSTLLFLQLKPGEHPNYPDGKVDNTHFNELGARLIAQLVLKEVRLLPLEINKHIVSPVIK